MKICLPLTKADKKLGHGWIYQPDNDPVCTENPHKNSTMIETRWP